MMPFQAMRLRRPSSSASLPLNFVNNVVFPSSNFTTASTTFVDLLDATAGSIISVSITKLSSTRVHVFGYVSGVASGGNIGVTLAVHDGSSDTVLATASLVTSSYGALVGSVILSGLAAGTYTLKLRVRISTGTQTLNFNTGASSATICAVEVDP